jgi:hypothetical protein
MRRHQRPYFHILDSNVFLVVVVFWHSRSQRIVEGMEVLKSEQLELIDQLSVVKIWIQLNIPKIEDGGNFGVSIQVCDIESHARAPDDLSCSLRQCYCCICEFNDSEREYSSLSSSSLLLKPVAAHYSSSPAGGNGWRARSRRGRVLSKPRVDQQVLYCARTPRHARSQESARSGFSAQHCRCAFLCRLLI